MPISVFQSTLSLRRATPVEDDPVSVRAISIHALLAESDPGRLGRVGAWSHFNPRSPCGERRVFAPRCLVSGYFNPRSPCGERRNTQFSPSRGEGISIHALLAESDSYRGTTYIDGSNFNPRSPCGERLLRPPTGEDPVLISIHALLAESDEQGYSLKEKEQYFNPRSPCGERLRSGVSEVNPRYFNPRSPCGERLPGLLHQFLSVNFNPRSPCGERPCSLYFLDHATRFQSTLSLRRATWPPSDTALTPWDFNPRSPCGERPGPGCKLGGRTSNFNPRSPCGERPGRVLLGPHRQDISIHALLAESDPMQQPP